MTTKTKTDVPEVTPEATPTDKGRVSAASVSEKVFKLILDAGPEGISLKDLGARCKAEGIYDKGLDDKAVYRKLHNVSWVLEGGPRSGKIEAKGWPELVSRVEGKGATYVATAKEFTPHKG